MNDTIKTPQTDPNHPTVGHHFAGHSFEKGKTQIYFCDSYDPGQGFWMTNIEDPADRKNVSERAICATYWPAEDMGDYWWVHQWGVKVWKTVNEQPKTQEQTNL